MTFRHMSFASFPEELLPVETTLDRDIGDDYDSDWFDYAIKYVDGTVANLIANRDGRYLLIRHQHSRVEGVLAFEEVEAMEKLLTSDKSKSYCKDSLRYDDEALRDRSAVIRQLIWMTPEQQIAMADWKEGNLSSDTAALLTALDGLVTTLSP